MCAASTLAATVVLQHLSIEQQGALMTQLRHARPTGSTGPGHTCDSMHVHAERLAVTVAS
jgi:hypothetical protein